MTEQEMIELLINSSDQYVPPTPEELAEAPILELWALLDVGDPDKLPTAVGSVYGHPFAKDGSLLVADECFAMAPDQTWVMTMSRLYRLGETMWCGGLTGEGHHDD